MTSSSGERDVIRLEKDASLRGQQPATLNPEVSVTLTEVKVVNSSCVRLYWQLIGQRAAVQWLRVHYWQVSSEATRRSVLVPVSRPEFILDGLEQSTRYGLCVQVVYKSGVMGKCSNTRHAFVTQQHDGNQALVYLQLDSCC